MRLSIVIVNWNTHELLKACLASVARHPPAGTYETLVVDNASTDASAAMVKREFPSVRLIESGANIGFGPANNLGLAAARGRFVLFLNPDTEVMPETLDRALTHAETDQRIGVVGVRQRDTHGRLQESCGHLPSLGTMTLQGLLGTLYRHGRTGLARRLAERLEFPIMPVKGLYPAFDFAKTQRVGWVMGAFMLVRREALDKAGGFDPYFMLYGEEFDLCRRIRSAGWEVSFLADAEILHHGGASTKDIPVRTDIMRCVAMIRYYQKHEGRLAAAVYRALIFAANAAALGIWTVRRRDSETARQRRRLARGRLARAVRPNYDGLLPGAGGHP